MWIGVIGILVVYWFILYLLFRSIEEPSSESDLAVTASTSNQSGGYNAGRDIIVNQTHASGGRESVESRLDAVAEAIRSGATPLGALVLAKCYELDNGDIDAICNRLIDSGHRHPFKHELAPGFSREGYKSFLNFAHLTGFPINKNTDFQRFLIGFVGGTELVPIGGRMHQLSDLLQAGEAIFNELENPDWGFGFTAPESESKRMADAWAGKVESELRSIGKSDLIYEFGRLSDEAKKRLQPNHGHLLPHRPAAEWVCHRIEQLKKIVSALPDAEKPKMPTPALEKKPTHTDPRFTYEDKSAIESLFRDRERAHISILFVCGMEKWDPCSEMGAWLHGAFQELNIDIHPYRTGDKEALPRGVSLWFKNDRLATETAELLSQVMALKNITPRKVPRPVPNVGGDVQLMFGLTPTTPPV